MTELTPIPNVEGFSLREGHRALEAGSLYEYVLNLSSDNGPISRFNGANVVITTAELSGEVCDEARFEKSPIAALGVGTDHTKRRTPATLRTALGNGLISSYNDEPAWGRGHRILGNAFSPGALHDHFDAVTDCVGQMVDRLESVDAGKDVEVVTLAGSLCFEVMALYAFSQRMGCFYADEPPPVVVAAARVVHELSLQRIIPPKILALDVKGNRQLSRDIAFFSAFAEQLVSARRALGPGNEGTDLLGHMLTTPDPQTGEFMPDSEVRYQTLTLLGAGQEGPHNLLSVALHFLASQPDLFARVRSQVDEVLGADSGQMPTSEQVSKLTLIEGLVNETLRMYPSAMGFARSARETTVIGGEYELSPDDSVLVFLPQVHRDPAVWPNPDEFDIDRWTPEMIAALPVGAFKPFGTGLRACLGRLLALTEVQTTLAVLVARFDLSQPSRSLEFGLALTLKPEPFTVRFTPRPGRAQATATVATAASEGATPERADTVSEDRAEAVEGLATPAGRGVRVWHASDGGTALGLASRVAMTARDHGFAAQLGVLNDAVDALDPDLPNIIIAASYNGEPATTGAAFMSWLAGAQPGALAGVDAAVFGCGDRHWTDTFQAVPLVLDEQLAAAGATQLTARGIGDSSADLDGAFAQWTTELWAVLAPGGGEKTGAGAALIPGGDPDGLAHALGFSAAEVVSTAELQRHWGPDMSAHSTIHLEVILPAGTGYNAGDHMLVLPRNRQRAVRQAAALFGMSAGSLIRMADAATSGGPDQDLLDGITALQTRFDLAAPATRSGIELLAKYVDGEGHREQLLALVDEPDAYQSQVLDKHVSLLDLARDFPVSEPLPVGQLDQVFAAMKPRTYSISSAPSGDGQQASLTVGVVEGPARSGQGTYWGTCSTFLASLRADDDFFVKVKRPGPGFSLPDDAATAVIMVCAGTGIAPFRGFLQELAARHDAGDQLAPIVLIRGCRRSDHDHIYGDEIAGWVAQGWLTYYEALSREPGQQPHHVEDVMLQAGPELTGLLETGAKVLVCGDSSRFYDDVEQTVVAMQSTASDVSTAQAQEWLSGRKAAGLYVVDIWAQADAPQIAEP